MFVSPKESKVADLRAFAGHSMKNCLLQLNRMSHRACQLPHLERKTQVGMRDEGRTEQNRTEQNRTAERTSIPEENKLWKERKMK